MNEANGSYKNKTLFIWQIKHKSRRLYNDNYYDEKLSTVLDWAMENKSLNLKTRIIKRTVKEEIITDDI